MSLLDDAVAAQRPRGPRCTVGLAIEQHPDLAAEILELVDAVAKGSIFATTAARIAASHDIDIKHEPILRHSKRGTPDGCGCR